VVSPARRVAISIAIILFAGIGSTASDVTPVRPVSAFDGITANLAPVSLSEPPHAVGRDGIQLMLDGQPFRFTGLNIFNAANLDSGSCWFTWGSGDLLDRALTAIGDGQTVFRIFFFQRTATVRGQRDWSGFDHTLQVARKHGERVIVTLGNQWKDCEGTVATFKTEGWYQSGYRDQPAPGLPLSYRDWVAEVVSRYSNDNTILAWQLMNEPSAQPSEKGGCSPTAGSTLRAFAADMGSLIKGLDPDHLVSLGTLGGGECGSAGNDYQALHAIPQIDLCTFHDYSPAAPASPPRNMGLLEQRLAQCRAVGKPLIISEAGITVRDAGSLHARAQIFRARLSAWFRAGVAGVLLWDLGGPPDAGTRGYQILPGDPLLNVLARVPSFPGEGRG
jgi:endo-1,4-beta-mannosidase